MPHGCGRGACRSRRRRRSSCWSRTAPSHGSARPARLPSAGPGARRRRERGAPAEALSRRWSTTTLAEHGLARASVACVVSLDLKAAEPAVHALAAQLGVPARFFAAARLLEETARLATPSEVVFRETGCWGVAEGAALAAVGPEGRLLVPKRKGERVTCAVALAPRDARPGTDRPAAGPARRRRPRARATRAGARPRRERLLAEAEELVGYGLYLDLIGPAGRRQAAPRVPARRRGRALPLRAGARRRGPRAWPWSARAIPASTPWRRWCSSCSRAAPTPPGRGSRVTVSPGRLGAAGGGRRAGAPLGHDFCAISLSDLLTPGRGDRAAGPGGGGRRLRRRPLQPGLAAPPRAAGPRPRHPAGAPPARHAGRPRPQPRPRRTRPLAS